MAAPSLPAVPAVPLPEPLRLPRGTVHGLLALVLMGTFVYVLTRTQAAAQVPQVLVNAVVVCLAFYFGSHGTAASVPGTAPGAVPSSGQPRIVRGLLLAGFGGLAGWFVYTGTPIGGLPAPLVEILQVLGGYILGLTLSWAFHRRAHLSDARRRLATLFRDVSAVGALGFTVFACYAIATGLSTVFGQTVEQALSLVITYYFGSRVLAH